MGEGRIREGAKREGCIVYKGRWEKGRLYSVYGKVGEGKVV